MSVVPQDPRLEGISSKAYEHPADRAATAALQAIPMLEVVVRKLIEFGYERSLRQFYLGNSVRVGPDQLPVTWAAYKRALHVLDVPDEHHLYVTASAGGNAHTVGANDPIVVVDSSLHELLDPDEQRAVLAHELGHVLSDHVLYRTGLDILLRAGSGVPFPFALPFRAVKAVLLEWSRAAELSCDRAATLAVRDPLIVCRSLMVVAGGKPSSELSLDAFLAQAQAYEDWEDPHDRVRRFFNEINATHAHAVRRVSEVMAWVRSGEYDRILGGDYRRRDDDPADPRTEAGDAVNFYSERFRSLFQDAGETVERFGAQVSEWLRRERGGES